MNPTPASNRRLRRALPWGGLAIIALSSCTLAFASGRIEKEESAYGGKQARECLPDKLNVSDVLPGAGLAVAPLRGSHDASPRTQISMLGAPPGEIANVSVSGSDTGDHRGRLLAYSQGDGASFVPDKPFVAGETVSVHGELHAATGTKHFSYGFTISYPDPIKYVTPSPPPSAQPGEVLSFHSAPDLHPPSVDVTYHDPQHDTPGYIFAAPYTGPAQTGPMIFEADGQPLWIDPLPAGLFATNLQVQEMNGRKVLTWWQGYIPPQGFGLGEEIVADSSYRPIMHVHPGNGFEADLHDFHFEPNNTALLTIFSTIHCNLSSDGGPRDAAVTDASYQELDLSTGLVRREWHSVDHVPLTASYASPVQSSAEWPFDYFHINSIDPRSDGSTLISARNTWGIYLLNTETGQITTTAGGKEPSVKMESGTSMAYQHDATTLPDGDISVFDNGGVPVVHPQSRVLILSLNPQEGTDSEVTQLDHPRPLQSGSQGNVQPLSDGNWFVDWGSEPYFTEFNSAGQMIYDAHMPKPTESYRGYKFEWTGTPSSPPAIAVEHGGHAGLEVYASWNGATGVASWRVLGGSSSSQLRTLTQASKSGFETTIEVPAEPYVQVQALDSSGAVIGTSATVKG
jgi:Arylsulfotransferase (ASST)